MSHKIKSSAVIRVQRSVYLFGFIFFPQGGSFADRAGYHR